MKKLTFCMAMVFASLAVYSQNSFNSANSHGKTGDLALQSRSNRSLTCVFTSLNNYVPGTTMDLLFTLNLSTPDFEYGDSLWMQFPAGVIINSASDPFAVATELQPDEILNTPIVSPEVSWGDNDNNYGGIEPGAHNFYVNVSIPSSMSGPITVNWYMSGDEFGAAPNFISGTFVVSQTPTTPDILIIGNLDNKYYQYPASQATYMSFDAQILNNGADLTTATDAIVSIIGTAGGDTTAVTVPFVNGAVQTLAWQSTLFLDSPSTYSILFDVTNPNDFNPLDNKDTIDVIVSDSTFSYTHPTIAINPFGIGDGSDGILGSIFEIENTQTLTSISCFSPLPDATANISFVVYEADMNGPTSVLVWESDTFSTTGGGVPTSYLRSTNISLTGGQRYLIGVREQATGNMSIGSNFYGYFANIHYAYFQGAWLEVGGAGFPYAFAIDANFSNSCVADFSFAIDVTDPMNVEFTNTSDLAGASGVVYNWDFGDGAGTANIENPTYTYSLEGTYNACLIIANGGLCSSTQCYEVVVDDGINGVAEIPSHLLNVYPNPSKGIVHVSYNNSAEILIYGIDGSYIQTIHSQPGDTEIDLNRLPEGTYLLKIISEEGVSVKRISLMK